MPLPLTRYRRSWLIAAAWCALTASPAWSQPVLELAPLVPRESAPSAPPAPLPPVQVQSDQGEVVQLVSAPPQPESVKPRVQMTLDSVFRLAQDQNGMVRLAREKLFEAETEQELAAKAWLPDLSVGAGWWRHEGGIQDFQGNMVRSSYGSVLGGVEIRSKLDLRERVFSRLEAERKTWQQHGELTKFTADQLLDAATTYVDLLAARAAEGIAIDAEKRLEQLLNQARSLEKVDSGLRVETARVESELGAQRMLSRRLREGSVAAAAKLIYLLGLDPATELVLVDKHLIELRLVDHQQAADALVQTALQRGPGVQETEAILSLLEEMRAKGESPLHFLPSLEVRMIEGAFGAAPGSRLDWENRWDLGVQARWNLTELLTGRQRKRLANLKIQQAQLGYEDLRGKLTLGVHEAREAANSNQDQIRLARTQIRHAEESYNLSNMRLRENVKGRSPSEVLLAIRSLMGAQLGMLHALRDFDKAQLRLFVLTGAAAGHAASPR